MDQSCNGEKQINHGISFNIYFFMCETREKNRESMCGSQTLQSSKIGEKHAPQDSGTGGTVCKGATPSVEQPGGRGFKPRLRSLLD